MIAIVGHVKRLNADESGATAIEYGLIASAMGLMLIPAINFFSGAFSSWAARIVDEFDTVMGR